MKDYEKAISAIEKLHKEKQLPHDAAKWIKFWIKLERDYVVRNDFDLMDLEEFSWQAMVYWQKAKSKTLDKKLVKQVEDVLCEEYFLR